MKRLAVCSVLLVLCCREPAANTQLPRRPKSVTPTPSATANLSPNAPTKPLPVGGDVKPPTMIGSPNLQFVECQKRKQAVGLVALAATIDSSGNVAKVNLIKPLPPCAEEEVFREARAWNFRPGTLRGKPVPVEMVLTVNIHYR